ncbi:MAG: DUF364 domain-containing protein [Dehalobacterium sp.]
MKQLCDAYTQIMQQYNDEGLIPGRLERIGFSGKWTGVFGTKEQSGIAFNFTGEHEFYGSVAPNLLAELQVFAGESLTCLAEYLWGKEGILYAALYLAVLNALSNPLNTKERLQKRGFSFAHANDFTFIKEDDFVTVIGAGGVVNQLRQHCKEVHVSDMRPKSALESFWVGKKIFKGPKRIIFHSPEENEELLLQSDVVFITGCTLVNRTIFQLLPMIKKARVIGMFGPSAMLLPDFLFGLGVNYISSSRIKNAKLIQGYMFEGFCGKKSEECMDSYSILI